jgi:hypothetical protein
MERYNFCETSAQRGEHVQEANDRQHHRRRRRIATRAWADWSG